MIRSVRNYIGGSWVDPTGEEFLDVRNPSTGQRLACVPLSEGAELNRAVAAARAAFPAWSQTPVARRCEPLYRLAEAIRDQGAEIERSIAAEGGKSLPDARAEVSRTLENCRVACGMPSLMQAESLMNVADGIDGQVIRAPLGVFGVIAPFNFPAMVPFWFMPYALAAGDTVVVKPSEQVPLTMERIFGLIDQCRFPSGVVNLVNGDRRVAEAMLEHPGVAGISFVGSSRVCHIVAQACAKTGKRFQALGSAKNYVVMMPDANLERAIPNLLTSCFGCAGQRCMAASVVACVGDDVYQRVVRAFVDAARQVKVGNPLDEELAGEAIVVGPVISAAAKSRIEGLIETAVSEGAELLLDGRGVTVRGGEDGYFVGPTILGEVRPGTTIERTEVFGPVVALIRFQSLDEAIQAINNHQYGNGASIYTRCGYVARKFKLETNAGMIGINIGIPAPVACLPFGGTKDSFQADIKAQGRDVLEFFTTRKAVTERYWDEL